MVMAGRTTKDYYLEHLEETKEYKKKWQQESKDKLKEKLKTYIKNIVINFWCNKKNMLKHTPKKTNCIKSNTEKKTKKRYKLTRVNPTSTLFAVVPTQTATRHATNERKNIYKL